MSSISAQEKAALKISQAAKILKISRSTLLRLEEAGQISSTRLENGYRVFSPTDVLILKDKLQKNNSLDLIEEKNYKAIESPKISEKIVEVPIEKVTPNFRFNFKAATIALASIVIVSSIVYMNKYDTGLEQVLSTAVAQFGTHKQQSTKQSDVLASFDTIKNYSFNVTVPSNFLSDVTIQGILSAPTLNDVIAINQTTETTFEQALEIAGEVISNGETGLTDVVIADGVIDGNNLVDDFVYDGTITTNGLIVEEDLISNGTLFIEGTWEIDGTEVTATAEELNSIGDIDTTVIDGITTTAGGVYFSDGSKLTQDATNFFWNDSTNRLGIGTNSPTSNLHIAGTLNVTGATTLNGVAYTWPAADGTSGQTLTTSGSGTLSWTSPSGGGTIDGAGTTNYLPLWSDSSTLTDSAIYQTGGNLGIGTTTPGADFHVYADALFGNNGLILNSGTNVLALNQLVTDASTRTYGIQVGIASNPASASSAQKYAVYGETSIYSGNAQNFTGRQVGVQGQFDHDGTGTVTEANGVRGTVGNNSTGTITTAKALVANYANTGTIGSLYGLHVLQGTNSGTITNNYGIYIDNITNGTTDYAIYSAGGQSYFAGNVGIGNTAPSNALDVNGNVGISSGNDLYVGNIGLGDTGASAVLSGASLVGTYDEFANSNATNVQEALNDLDAAIGSGASKWTQGTGLIYLTNSTDEVIIGGSSSLSSKLAIDGDADELQFLIQGNSSQTANLMLLEQSDGDDLLAINNDGDLLAGFTQLDGTDQANGTGSGSNTLTVDDSTGFDVGNYIRISSSSPNCASGISLCYSKIRSIAGNVITVSNNLNWADNSPVLEFHIPEVGGTNTASTLTNRYGQGFFISGTVAGNASTYYGDQAIYTSDRTGADSPSLSITTGTTTTSGNSGDISIDTGSAAGTAGNINIGTTAANSIIIGRSGITTEILGNLTVNNEAFTDLTGDGLTITSNALTIDLTTATDALSSTISNGSGLEVLPTGLTLLQGCATGQILKWNESNDSWECGNDTGATSAIINVENNDVAVGTNVDTLDFTSDFLLTASPSNEANIAVADDILNFTEFSDTLVLDSSTSFNLYNGSSNTTARFFNSNTGRDLLFINGNSDMVGIGTTAPQQELHVAGDIQIQDNSFIGLGTASGRLDFDDLATDEINFLSANVGIGSTTPSALLSVGASNQFTVDSSGNLTKINNIAYSWPGSQASADNYVLVNNGSGTLTWEDISGVGGLDGSGTTNYLPLWSDTNTLTSSAVYQTGGNVGIGTTAPSSLLHVAGILTATTLTDGTASLNAGTLDLGTNTITDGTLTGNWAFSDGDLTGINSITADNTITFSGLGTGTDNTVVILNGSNQLTTDEVDSRVWGTSLIDASSGLTNYVARFSDADTLTTGLIYDTGSFVGIGTTNPGVLLDIAGGDIRTNQQLVSTVSTGTAPLAVSSTTLVSNLNSDLLDGLTSADFLRSNTDDSFEASNTLTIAGTIDITGVLEIDGTEVTSTAAEINYLDGATATNGGLVFGNGTYLTQDSANLFWDDSTNRLGIGTTSPSASLSVGASSEFRVSSTGDLTRVNNIAYAWPGSQAASDNYVLVNDGNGTLTWEDISGVGGLDGTGTANYLPLWSDTNTLTSSAVYQTGGSVGIGTTAPSSLLHVAGTLTATTFTDGTASLSSGTLDLGTNTILDGNLTGNWAFNNGDLTGVNSITADNTITFSGLGTGTDNTVVILNGSNQLTTDEIDTRVWGSSLLDGTGTANYVARFSDADTLATGVLYDNATNIGIGTTNPGTLLDVVGGNIRTNQQLISTIATGTAPLAVSSTTLVSNLNADLLDSLSSADFLRSNTDDSFDASNTLTIAGTIDITGAIEIDGTEVTSTATELNLLGGSTATNGGLVFGNGTYLTQDSANLFWDDSTNRLGIGSTTPASQLSVGASNQFQVDSSGDLVKVNNIAYAWPDAQATSDNYVLTNDGNGALTWESISGAGGLDGSGTTNYLPLWSDSNTLTSSSIYETGSEIGIGTTAPSEILTVAGNIALGEDNFIGISSSTERLVFDGSGNTAQLLGANFGIGNTSPSALLTVGASGQFTVDSSGNLTKVNNIAYSWPGSQAASDNYVLTNDGSGNLAWESISGAGAVDGSGLANYIARWSDSNSLTTGALYDTGTLVGIGTTAPSQELEVAGDIQIQDNSFVGLGSSAGRIDFDDLGTDEINFLGANVGVGSTTPSALFNVGATNQFRVDSSGNLTRINDIAYSWPAAQAASDNYVLTNDGSGNLAWEAVTGAGAVDGSGTANYITRWSDSNTVTDSAIYQNGSSIGIGTTAPSSLLHVAGTLTATTFTDGTASLNSGTLDLGTNTILDGNFNGNWAFNSGDLSGIDALSAGGTITLTGLGTGTDNTVVILNGSNQLTTDEIDSRVWGATLVDGSGTTNYLPYYSDSDTLADSSLYYTGGNIGIGTTAPSKLLELLSTNEQLRLGYNESVYTDFMTNSSGYLSISPTGSRVGIGTTAPSYLLEVNGTFQADTIFSIGGIESNLPLTGANRTISNTGRDLTITADNLIFAIGGTEKFRLASSGFVGIGTTAPAQELHVAGDIQINDGSFIGLGSAAGRIDFDDDTTDEINFLTANVGIGSTTPASLLSVGASNQFQVDSNGDLVKLNNIAYAWPDAQATSDNYVLVNDGAGTLTWEDISGVGGLDGTGTANYLPLWSDSNTLTSSVAYQTGGQIGIGTTAPSSLLHVAGTLTATTFSDGTATLSAGTLDLGTNTILDGNLTGNWALNDGNLTGVNSITADNTITFTGLGTGTDNTVVILNSSNQLTTDEIDARVWGTTLVDGTATANYIPYMSDTDSLANSSIYYSGGNLGIGTTAPAAKLDIKGDIFTDQYLSSSTNTFLGISAASDGTLSHTTGQEGWYNTALGSLALQSLTTGNKNVGVGYGSGIAVTTGASNVFLGMSTGSTITTGSNNIGIGENALGNASLGAVGNVGIGAGAVRYVSGNYGVGIGMNAGLYNTTAGNTYVGGLSGQGASSYSASGLTLIGYQAGYVLASSANNNTFIGYQAGDSVTSGANNILIGYGADTSSATASNELNIGGTIYGNLSSGNIGIGITNPGSKLQVAGVITPSADDSHDLGTTSLQWQDLFLAGTLDLGTNTITDGTLTGNWAFSDADLTGINSITADNTITFSGLASSSTEDTIVVLNTSNQLEQREFSDFLSDNGVLDGTGTANYLPLWSDTNTLTSSAAYQTGGLVGIGTTAPSKLLEVLSASEQLRLGYSESVYTDVYTNSNGYLAIVPTGARVGIGTTTPSDALEIEGALASAGLTLDSSNGAGIILDRGSTSNFGILRYYTAGTEFWRAGTFDDGTDNYYIADPSNNKFFTLEDAGSTGNVGIGTTNPNELLSIGPGNQLTVNTSGDLTTSGTITANGILDANGIVTIGDNGDTIALDSSDWDINTTGDASGFGAISADGTITFSGLGTGTDNSVVILNSSNQLTTDEIDSRVWSTSLLDGSGTANYVAKYSDADTLTTGVLYDSGTNVGIGTTAPNDRLEVVSTSDAQLRLAYNTSSYQALQVASDGGLTWSALGTDADLDISFAGATDGDFSINTDDLFVDTSTGYVGVNTTSPDGRFEVVSGTDQDIIFRQDDADGWQVRITGVTDTNKQLMIGYDTGSDNGTIQAIKWGTAVEPLQLNPSGGGVTIGVNAVPAAALEINDTNGDNLRLTYNDSNGSATAYTDFSLASDGDLTIDSAGNNIAFGAADIITASANVNADGGLDIDDAFVIADGGVLTTSQTANFDGSADFDGNVLISDTDIAFDGASTTFTTTGAFTLTPGGAVLLGDGGDTLQINSSDWDISTTGDLTGIGAITANGSYTTSTGTGTGIDLTRSAAGQWMAFNDGTDTWGLYNTAGSPEGVLAANTGALSMDTTNGTLYVKTDDTDNTGWVNLATGGSTLWTDGGNYIYADNATNVSITDTGFIGIGTTAPVSEFQVAGTTPQIWLGDAGAEDTSLVFDGNAVDFYMGLHDANDDLIFGTGSTIGSNALFTIENGGNVGIGTTAPSASLHILDTTEQLRLGYDTSNYMSFTIDSSGNLTIADSGTNVATFGQTQASFEVPASFNAVGDVSIANDIILTNQNSNNIKSYGPLTLESGEVFENNNLTLTTYGTGNIVANLGTGTTSPNAFIPGTDDLHDLGSSTFRWDDVYATNGTIQTSDIRLKENINDIEYGLDEIMQLRPVSYTWIGKPDKGNKLGLIAQEAVDVVPEIVDIPNEEDGGYWGLRYSDLVPVLIKGIQEQQLQIEELQAQVGTDETPETTTSQNDQASSMLAEITAIVDDFKDFIASLGMSVNTDDEGNSNLTISNDLNVLGDTTLFDAYVTGDLAIGTIAINSLDSSISTVAQDETLYLQNHPLAGDLDIFNGKIVLETDGTLNAEKVVAGSYAVRESAQTIGNAAILAGQSQIVIENTNVKTDSKIFVTATTSTLGNQLYVSDKADGQNFTISIDNIANQDIKFDWWIVDVE